MRVEPLFQERSSNNHFGCSRLAYRKPLFKRITLQGSVPTDHRFRETRLITGRVTNKQLQYKRVAVQQLQAATASRRPHVFLVPVHGHQQQRHDVVHAAAVAHFVVVAGVRRQHAPHGVLPVLAAQVAVGGEGVHDVLRGERPTEIGLGS